MSQLHNIQDATGVAIKDSIYGIDYVKGTTVPTDGTAGYAVGCFFKDRDGTAGSQVYINEGTLASCSFKPLLTASSAASTREILAGSTLTVTQALHDNKTIRMPAACAITLPASTGSGARYRFVQQVTATTVTITATAADLYGNALVITDNTNAMIGFNAAGSTVITMNGTTQGGIKGAIVEIEDVATNFLVVRMNSLASGTEASPFS